MRAALLTLGLRVTASDPQKKVNGHCRRSAKKKYFNQTAFKRCWPQPNLIDESCGPSLEWYSLLGCSASCLVKQQRTFESLSGSSFSPVTSLRLTRSSHQVDSWRTGRSCAAEACWLGSGISQTNAVDTLATFHLNGRYTNGPPNDYYRPLSLPQRPTTTALLPSP